MAEEEAKAVQAEKAANEAKVAEEAKAKAYASFVQALKNAKYITSMTIDSIEKAVFLNGGWKRAGQVKCEKKEIPSDMAAAEVRMKKFVEAEMCLANAFYVREASEWKVMGSNA